MKSEFKSLKDFRWRSPLIFIAVQFSLPILVYAHLKLHNPIHFCGRDAASVLAGPPGLSVKVTGRDCGDFDDPNLILVKLRKNYDSKTIFSYEPYSIDNDLEPKIEWINEKELIITVSTLWSIKRQISEWNDIKIYYKIDRKFK